MNNSKRRFKVALSFPGERRGVVEQVANFLAERFGRDQVLYDKYHEAEFAVTNLDTLLQRLYHDESDLIAAFLCADYEKKEWCGLEWRACRDLINRRHESAVMLFRFDDTKIDGLFPTTDGYIWIGNRSAAAMGDLILKRLEINATNGISVNVRSPGLESGTPLIAPSRLSHGAQHLFGREEELACLDKAWNDPGTHVVAIIAWGGVGKTALVSDWQATLAKRDYDGASYFDWSFYSQGARTEGAASADTFIKAALLFFGDKQMAESPASPWDKGACLAQLVAQRRTLLVLDGLEPLQHSPGPMGGQLKDPAMTALLKGLAQKNPGLCVVTTRERVTDLDSYTDRTVFQWDLHRLPLPAGVALLRQLGVRGTDAEFKALVEDVDGHALTLNLLGSYLSKAHKGDIRKRDQVKFEEADAKIQGGHAFRMLAAYEKWLANGGEDAVRGLAVLRLLGLFDRPADSGCIGALRQPPVIAGLTDPIAGIDDAAWNLAISGLMDCRLVSTNEDRSTLDAHPLIREYFAEQLSEKNRDAWRAAHRRLYEYLTQSTEDKPEPSLEELQPLYQAVAHGCSAGMQHESLRTVYERRILKGTGLRGFYSRKRLCAFGADLGAIAHFFEIPWRMVSEALSEADRAWVLNEAAVGLWSLGRSTEAVEPMRISCDIDLRCQRWDDAVVGLTNLSQLEVTLADLTAAVQHARQSVEVADRTGDYLLRAGSRTTLADALHQAGQASEAIKLFRKAETLQSRRPPYYRLLYSLRGFQYADLLLSGAERAAWQREQVREPAAESACLCREVARRATEAMSIVLRGSKNLLDIALNHLTLGRAFLYLSILDPSQPAHRLSAIDSTNSAANELLVAGSQQHLPRGFLSRAWLRFLEKDLPGARADLVEAQAIAERGSMQLHLADVHLHHARLFHDKAELRKARALIEKCGYWRRKGELEDAEAAAGEWESGG